MIAQAPVVAAQEPATDLFSFDPPSSAQATNAASDPFGDQFSSLNLDQKDPEPAFDFGISKDPEPLTDMFAQSEPKPEEKNNGQFDSYFDPFADMQQE